MIYIVTVKLPKNPDHDPAEKKTGSCPLSAACWVGSRQNRVKQQLRDIERNRTRYD